MRTTISGTKEWAYHNLNICSGCSHGCRYCFAQSMAMRFKQLSGRPWTEEVIESKRLAEAVKKYPGRIMFPSTHDITPRHLQESLGYIERILAAGNNLLIVSKPHLDCVRAICDRFKAHRDMITFRFTIGSADSGVLAFWEPGAPDFAERLASLKHAHSRGYVTSVSCEPMLDNDIDKVVDHVLPYVSDSIWLGKANKLMVYLSLNGHKDPETRQRAKDLLAWQCNANIQALYARLKTNPKIKWKESIKKVVGIELATEPGLDI